MLGPTKSTNRGHYINEGQQRKQGSGSVVTTSNESHSHEECFDQFLMGGVGQYPPPSFPPTMKDNAEMQHLYNDLVRHK